MQGLLLVQLFARVVFCTRLKHPRSCLVQVVRLKRTLLSRPEIVGSLESDEGPPEWAALDKNLRKMLYESGMISWLLFLKIILSICLK